MLLTVFKYLLYFLGTFKLQILHFQVAEYYFINISLEKAYL